MADITPTSITQNLPSPYLTGAYTALGERKGKVAFDNKNHFPGLMFGLNLICSLILEPGP